MCLEDIVDDVLGVGPPAGQTRKAAELTYVAPEDQFRKLLSSNPNEYTRRLSIKVTSQGLHNLCSNPGYQSFSSQASSYNSEWKAFPGHVISDNKESHGPDPSSNDKSSQQGNQAPSKHCYPRESSQVFPSRLGIATTFPCISIVEPDQQDKIPTYAVETDFEAGFIHPTKLTNDSSVTIMQYKQHELSVCMNGLDTLVPLFLN